MIRRILLETNEEDLKVLTTKSSDVIIPLGEAATSFNTAGLVQDLIDTLKNEPTGIGLAANQIGWLKNVFIIKPANGADIKVFINPQIISYSGGVKQSTEGCLSRPGKTTRKRRAKVITVKRFDLRGNEHKEKYTRRDAIVIQHEMDHLKGVLV